MSEVGRVTDGQGNVGTVGERVTLQTHGVVDLTADLTEEFGRKFIAACWQVAAPWGAS